MVFGGVEVQQEDEQREAAKVTYHTVCGLLDLVRLVELDSIMISVNIHEAKTHLSRLVDRAARGEPFVIAKAGKPMVRVSAIDTPAVPQRLGFLEGEIRVPRDFNRMGADSIESMFSGHAAADEAVPEPLQHKKSRRKKSAPRSP